MSHLDVAQMIVTNRLAREVEACVKTAVLIGRGAFTVYESVRVTLTLDPCQGPELTMMPMHDCELWEPLGKPHEADEFEFLRALITACVSERCGAGAGGFTQKSCRSPGPEPPVVPEILTWRWTADAAGQKEAS